MKIPLLRLAAVGVLAACRTQGADMTDAAIRLTFIAPWLDAMHSMDPARVKVLYHPKVLACITNENREFFDWAFAREAGNELSGSYKVTKVAPVTGPMPELLPAATFPVPVQPAYEVDIQIDYTNFVRFLAPDNGSWYEVLPCPNAQGMADFRAQLAAGAEQQKRAGKLVAELKEPLRGELKSLMKAGQFIDAIKRYQAAKGTDLTTAHSVIELLEVDK